MKKTIGYISAFLAALTGVQAGIDLNSAQNVAIYWGKTSIRDPKGLWIES
jgi:chitinase